MDVNQILKDAERDADEICAKMAQSEQGDAPDEREEVLFLLKGMRSLASDVRHLADSREGVLRELAQAQRQIERIQGNCDKTMAQVLELHQEQNAKWQKEKSVLIGALQYIASPRQWLSRLCAKPNETMSVQECAQRALNLTRGDGL